MNRLIVAGFIGLTCAIALGPGAGSGQARSAAGGGTAATVRSGAAENLVRGNARADGRDRARSGELLLCRLPQRRAKAAGMDSACKISLDSIDLTNVHAHAEKLDSWAESSARA